ncbi:MAG: thioredoxin domain-containing protein [Candidatus Colwellbacteria bacterium]|nr:thioredoxin domain-containing protein [Candidatus Colwellbacteria bacterium]
MQEKIEKYSIPVAIIIAGALVAVAVIFTGSKTGKGADTVPANIPAGDGSGQPAADLYKNVKAVTSSDHILGNKDAKIKIVTFSDMECPFCIRFETTMRKLVSDYNGDVAWVYRHNPLEGLHQNAVTAVDGAECSAKIGGEDKFWTFMEKFTIAVGKANGGLVNIADLAVQSGVDKAAFDNCYGKGQFDEKINDQMADASASGLEGTPYSVVMVNGIPVASINGAYPIEDVKSTIDSFLK